MVALATGNVGVGIVGVGTSKRVGTWMLREVLQEDGRLQLLHLYFSKLEGSLVGHVWRQGAGPFQEVVHLAKQASGPLWVRRTGEGLRAGTRDACAGAATLDDRRCWEQGQRRKDRAVRQEKRPSPSGRSQFDGVDRTPLRTVRGPDTGTGNAGSRGAQNQAVWRTGSSPASESNLLSGTGLRQSLWATISS